LTLNGTQLASDVTFCGYMQCLSSVFTPQKSFSSEKYRLMYLVIHLYEYLHFNGTDNVNLKQYIYRLTLGYLTFIAIQNIKVRSITDNDWSKLQKKMGLPF